MSETVLAIRPRALGDIVLLTPALRALKRGHPDAALEVVIEPQYAALIEGLPEVSRVWKLERSNAGTLRLLTALRRRRIRAAVDFFGNARTALLTALCGARARFGFDLRGRAWAYDTREPRTLKIPDASPGERRFEYAAATHVRLACAAGGRPDGVETRVRLSEGARAAAERALDQAGIKTPERTVGLVAAGHWPTKTWPAGHAAGLARALIAAGYPVLLLSGPGEEPLALGLHERVPGLSLLPPGDVETLAGVIARLAAVVGTDSGPRHLAAAFGVPTFAWFGPARPENWNPPGERHGFWQTELPCHGCNRSVCPHWNCLPRLSPAEATRLVLRHLESHGRAAAAFAAAAGA